ncbi:MAG: NYN domain-containing protein [Hymenobacteraceae bacterium]|nr:NYN domain-containing protein [Hymenobacteraceae bacterium]
MDTKLTRIGVFYDGNYFLHVSNYYTYQHARHARLSVSGLHQFIRQSVATEEATDPRTCHIVDAHYFRGRLSAAEAQRANKLFADRQFDDILMKEGVVTHYLPIKQKPTGRVEKGIDVWYALECYELAVLKKFDVVCLIASDGDYVPLIRKLNTLGIRVVLLSWDFEFTDDAGQPRATRTSQDLLEEVTYPIAMHEVIDNRLKRNDALVNNLFVKTEPVLAPITPRPATAPNGQHEGADEEEDADADDQDQVYESVVKFLKSGYGFIAYPPNNLFFHQTDMVNADFNLLREGDAVQFNKVKIDEERTVAKNVRRVVA